jgi:hypothetical protein
MPSPAVVGWAINRLPSSYAAYGKMLLYGGNNGFETFEKKMRGVSDPCLVCKEKGGVKNVKEMIKGRKPVQ